MCGNIASDHHKEFLMQVRIDRKILFGLLDELVARRRTDRFPFTKPDAIIPQKVIPEELRRDKKTLACFYFYVCIYMRGGIESLQVFNALIRMWREHPLMFSPFHAQWVRRAEVQTLLKQYIGWDSKEASRNWGENSRQLVAHWDSNPLNLLKGLRDYDEALLRIKNKRTKREMRAAGPKNAGFRGFQPKMVSMLVYFYDWEGWLGKRFLYPAPADFHNFRLGLNQGAIMLLTNQLPDHVRPTEEISKPWRDGMMEYLADRKADPIEVADAIWLFSLVMCGNSPLNRPVKTNGTGMFEQEELPHEMTIDGYTQMRFRPMLEATCLRCPIVKTCSLSIPSQPYYRKGQLVLRPRLRVEEKLGTLDPDARPRLSKPLENLHLFDSGG